MFSDQGTMNDFYMFDLNYLEWITISCSMDSMPSARYGHGFTSAIGKLYIFGGRKDAFRAGNLPLVDVAIRSI